MRSSSEMYHAYLAKGKPKYRKATTEEKQRIVSPEEQRSALADLLCPMGKTGCLFPRVNACRVVEQAMYCRKASYSLPSVI